MTDMEKKVVARLCAKILSETDLYDTDMEVRNLIDWICVSEQIKSNNNEIRSLTGEYKRIEPDCREGVKAQLERMKSLCKERDSLYERQAPPAKTNKRNQIIIKSKFTIFLHMKSKADQIMICLFCPNNGMTPLVCQLP